MSQKLSRNKTRWKSAHGLTASATFHTHFGLSWSNEPKRHGSIILESQKEPHKTFLEILSWLTFSGGMDKHRLHQPTRRSAAPDSAHWPSPVLVIATFSHCFIELSLKSTHIFLCSSMRKSPLIGVFDTFALSVQCPDQKYAARWSLT